MKLAKTWNKKLSRYDLNYNNLPFIGQYFKITTKPIKSSLITLHTVAEVRNELRGAKYENIFPRRGGAKYVVLPLITCPI